MVHRDWDPGTFIPAPMSGLSQFQEPQRPPDPEKVDHPAHYNKHPSGVECIDIVEHMSFNCGNAVKYIWRADHKSDSPIEDLEKAAWYIKRELERLK